MKKGYDTWNSMHVVFELDCMLKLKYFQLSKRTSRTEQKGAVKLQVVKTVW